MDLWAALDAADAKGVFTFDAERVQKYSYLSDVTNIMNDVGKTILDVDPEGIAAGHVAKNAPRDLRPAQSDFQRPINDTVMVDPKGIAAGHVAKNAPRDLRPAQSDFQRPINDTVMVDPKGIAAGHVAKNAPRDLRPAQSDFQRPINDTVMVDPKGGNVVKTAPKTRILRRSMVKTGAKKPGAKKPWSYVAQFTIDSEHWKKLHSNLELDDKYVEYFTNHIASKLKIACVLKSGGPFIGYGKFNMRFHCTNGPCKRKFIVKQIVDSNFKLYDNGEPEDHQGNKKTRPVRNVKRKIVAKALVRMNPEDYIMFCQNGVTQDLYERGHLQDLISTGSATKIRNDELVKDQDYDKDDVIDLLKMKLSDDYKFNVSKEGTDIFIRRLNLDPFAVLMYSNSQLKLLHNLSRQDDDLKLYFDATGGVARHAKNRVYYYCGVCCVKINIDDIKEKARLQPMVEFLSGQHDAHNIRLLLEDFKNDYEIKYPNSKWPIRYVITDFSFALMNAICRAWNCVSLLTYINLTYKFANDPDFKDKLAEHQVYTLLQLCCGHFSKTQCKDVAKYFPNLDSKKQSVLKEVLLAMHDISELQKLRDIWISLSTLLLSKYVDSNVENSLKNLTDIILSTSKNKDNGNEDQEETNSDDEDDMPRDHSNFEPIYKQSEYYKDFSCVTYKPQFQMGEKLKIFYNVEFSNVVLKKYISILCFWTCITQSRRVSNAPDECQFKNSKGRLKRKCVQIGALPLKAGRLCRELQQYTNGVTVANLMQYPRKNNCYKQQNKRKAADDPQNPPIEKKLKVIDSSASILSLYRATPKLKTPQNKSTPKLKTPQNKTTPKPKSNPKARTVPSGITSTPTTTSASSTTTTATTAAKGRKKLIYETEIVPIDDSRVEEQWYKRRPTRYSHMERKVLQEISSITETERKQLLTKVPKSAQNNDSCLAKLKNGLIDNPDIYLKATATYAVSRLGNVILMSNDYQSLSGKNRVTMDLLSYVFANFQSSEKQIQFELSAIAEMLDSSSCTLKIKRPVLIGLHENRVVVINCTKKSFAYIDPTTNVNQSEQMYLQKLIDFLPKHNAKFPKNSVAVDGWKVKNYDHKLCDLESDRTLACVRYVQLFTQNKLNEDLNIEAFRTELLHLILWKSMSMKDRCVLCGKADLPEKDGETSTIWVECSSCKRWVHLDCLPFDVTTVEKDTVNYFCVICKSNTAESS